MLRPDRKIERVYLHRQPVDMRKQMDGLAAIVQHAMARDVLDGSLYVFIGKRRDKLKILAWENNGFVIWYKRLEAHRFPWPKRSPDTVLTLTGEQLNWLLDGIDVWRMQPHQALRLQFVS